MSSMKCLRNPRVSSFYDCCAELICFEGVPKGLEMAKSRVQEAALFRCSLGIRETGLYRGAAPLRQPSSL